MVSVGWGTGSERRNAGESRAGHKVRGHNEGREV